MKNFFSEHRFVFMGERAPERREQRSRAEILAAQRNETRAIYSTARERQRMIRDRKKVNGEKFEEKEARLDWGSTMVVKLNGMPGRIDAGDKVNVLAGGQVYEMGGENYVKVAVRPIRNGRRKPTFYGYVKVAEIKPRKEATEYNAEGEKLIEDFKGKLEGYLEEKGLQDRFKVELGSNGDEDRTITVVDSYKQNTVCSWTLVDHKMDGGDKGRGIAPRYLDESHLDAPGASLVMGKPGLEGLPSSRQRLYGKDTMHYSANDGFKRALQELNGYIAKNGDVTKPISAADIAARRAAIKAGGEKLIKALKAEAKANFPGYDLKIEQTGEFVTIFDNVNKVILSSIQVDPDGATYTIGVPGGTQATRLEGAVSKMFIDVSKNMGGPEVLMKIAGEKLESALRTTFTKDFPGFTLEVTRNRDSVVVTDGKSGKELVKVGIDERGNYVMPVSGGTRAYELEDAVVAMARLVNENVGS